MDIMKSIPHIYFEKFPMFDDQISQFGTDSTMFDYQHCSNTTCSSIRSNIHSNGSANSSSLSNHQNIENDSQDELSFSPRPTDDNSMESNENSTKCISPIDCTEDVSNQDSTNVIFENDNISVPSGAKDLIINASSNVISPPLHHHTYIQSHKNRRKSSEPLKVMVNHTLRGPLKKRIKLNEQFNCYFNTTSINNDDSDIKNNNSNNINIDKNNKNIDNIDNIDNENEKDCKIENITVDTDDKKINIIVDQHSSNSIENKHFRPWDTTTNNETSTFDQDIQDEPLALLTKKKCLEPKSIPMAMPLLKQNSSKEFIKQYIPSSSSSPPPPPLSLVVPLSPALPPPPPPPPSSHHQIYLPIIPRSSTSPNSCTLPLTLSPAVVPSVRSSTITESILPPPPPPTSVSSSSSLVGYYGDNKYTSRNHSSTASPNSSQSMPPSPSSHSFKSTTNNNKLTKKHRNTSKSVSNLKSSSASPAHHHLQHQQQQQQQQQRNYKNMTKARRIEANARERSRVHTISAAYETLRKNVPSYSNTQKLSKLSVLRIAISYIDTLKRIANGDEDDAEDGDDDDDDDDRSLTTTNENNHRNQLSLSELVSEVTKTIQTEGKIRKKKDE